MERQITIRTAKPEDARFLSALSAQLGYPCDEGEVESRIRRIAGLEEEDVLVAEDAGRVIAWTSVQVARHFYLEPFAEISGFVVEETFRNRGVGRELLDAAAHWAKDKGCGTLRLKTNVTRKDAHRFYENNGFERTKEQYVYLRSIV